jgi:hypothetical protein
MLVFYTGAIFLSFCGILMFMFVYVSAGQFAFFLLFQKTLYMTKLYYVVQIFFSENIFLFGYYILPLIMVFCLNVLFLFICILSLL